MSARWFGLRPRAARLLLSASRPSRPSSTRSNVQFSFQSGWIRDRVAARSAMQPTTDKDAGGTAASAGYHVIRKLAQGGMAEIFLARHRSVEGFQRHVVIKRILPELSQDPEFVSSFLNEAKLS